MFIEHSMTYSPLEVAQIHNHFQYCYHFNIIACKKALIVPNCIFLNFFSDQINVQVMM